MGIILYVSFGANTYGIVEAEETVFVLREMQHAHHKGLRDHGSGRIVLCVA